MSKQLPVTALDTHSVRSTGITTSAAIMSGRLNNFRNILELSGHSETLLGRQIACEDITGNRCYK